MASQKTLNAYKAVQAHLNRNNFKFDTHDDDLVISLTVNGEDLPIQTIVRFMDNRELMQVLCYMPKAPEEKRVDVALAVAVANYGIVNGSFDYDMSDGELRFRVAQSYACGELTDDLIRYLLGISFNTTDKYNDRFFMLSKGMITLEQFIDLEKQ